MKNQLTVGNWYKSLFWCPEGPSVRYGEGVFIVDDLNPENEIKFRMTSWELLLFGFKCTWVSVISYFNGY